MKVLKLKYIHEQISEKKRCVLLKFGFPTIIDIQLESCYLSPLCSSIINIFPTKILKPMLFINYSIAIIVRVGDKENT